jgi:hypothetical protein
MGAFDDLIPENKNIPTAIGAPAKSNQFGDLIPKQSDTFIGKLPIGPATAPLGSKESFVNPESLKDISEFAAGGPGMKVIGAKGINFGKGIKSVLTKIAPKELAYGVQKAHDKLSQQASNIYDFIKSEVGPRGVGKINVAEDLIKEAESHLPKTRANKDLIERARTGNYEALHDLQSDLGKRGTKALGADLAADRNIGEEMLDTRGKINDVIKNQFNEYGHPDLTKLLEEANGKYTKLKKLYYSHPKVAKLVHPESRLVPKNPLSLFSEESKPMKELLGEHPEIQEALDTSERAKNFIEKLKKIPKSGYAAGGVGAGGLSLYGGKRLIDLLKGEGE